MEKYVMLADDVLVSLYREGDNEAFDTLLARYQTCVFTYILKLTSNDEDAANDVFQDTFVHAIMAIREGRYVASNQMQAWLMRIARNLVLDRMRSSRVRKHVNHEVVDAQGNVVRDFLDSYQLSECTVETQLMNQQSCSLVRALVDRLPDVQREVVEMRFYEELSFKEIAMLTGVSINTALGRMRYAMLNLKRMAQHTDLHWVG